MSTVEFHAEGITVTITRETVDVTSIHPVTAPDPEWSYVDSAGHKHEYDDDLNVPTVRSVLVDEYWCSTCCDIHYDYERRCTECDERIEPGRQVERRPFECQRVGGPVRVEGTVRQYENPKVFSRLRRTFTSRQPATIKVGDVILENVVATNIRDTRSGKTLEFVAESVQITRERE